MCERGVSEGRLIRGGTDIANRRGISEETVKSARLKIIAQIIYLPYIKKQLEKDVSLDKAL